MGDESPICAKCDEPIESTANVTYSPDDETYHSWCNPWRMCADCGEMVSSYRVHRGSYYCSDCGTPDSGTGL